MAILGILKVHLHGGKGMRNVDFLGLDFPLPHPILSFLCFRFPISWSRSSAHFAGKNDPYAVISYKTQDQKSKTLEGK
jgi:hypothetical protein